MVLGSMCSPSIDFHGAYHSGVAVQTPWRVLTPSLTMQSALNSKTWGVSTVDLSIFKNTQIGRQNLQFRVEIFNLFNRANFATPTVDALFTRTARGFRARRVSRTRRPRRGRCSWD
ncbi:MAG: hypothetical protein DMF94_03490 [Acidobacteria bacterium]|nr:MAG: hypothetical protein DMF94_03490 [Acidobacteriota bacterium]